MLKAKHKLEFFPKIIFTIPEAPGGSCCLKPIPKQTEESRKMYRFAKHLQFKNKDNLDFVIPSKTESRVRAIMKWKKFKARMRLRKLRIDTLPALVLDGKVLCQGKLTLDENFDPAA
jgi:hypothetical protein